QGNTTSFHIEGRAPDPSIPQDALYRAGTPDYLRTIGAQLVSGRLLDARDGPDAPLSVVINETMARRYFPDDTPLGHRMSFGRPDSPLYTIVGVIKDVRERGYELAMKPAVYLPYVREIWAVPEYLLIRARSNPADLAGPARRLITEIDPDQPISSIRTMDEILDVTVADGGQQMQLLGVFASLALLLASLGLYGVLSYAVAQRSRELGLRMALGASAESVIRMVVGRGLWLTALGVVAGLA